MFEKINAAGGILIFAGIIILLVNRNGSHNLFYAPYILIVLGILFLIISSLVLKKEKSLLCRIGFHDYREIGRDPDTLFFIYKCERCGKKKKAAKIM